MQIAGFVKTSLIEWPGKVSAVIFTLGCNFRCPFCHNPNLIKINKKTVSELLSEKEILIELEKRKEWGDGVCLTGGEPTLQKDLPVFLNKLKKMGYLTMLETNGSRPEILKKLLKEKLVDFLAMDLKGNFDNYPEVIKKSQFVKKVEESISLLINCGLPFEFRTTVVPGLHNLENLMLLANELKIISGKNNYPKEKINWFLQEFRTTNCFDKNFMKLEPFSREEMSVFQKKIQKVIPNTFLRGL